MEPLSSVPSLMPWLDVPALHPFPLPLSSYPAASPGGLLPTLSERVHVEPFNVAATAIFLAAIVHTFMAAQFTAIAHRQKHHYDSRRRAVGLPPTPSVRAELLHFLGEVDVVFGLWVLVLIAAIAAYFGWDAVTHYINGT